MNVPVLRVKKVRYPEKKSPKVASKTRQKKMSELDPFFNDEALVKGITKDSRRLRPYCTVCVMPKYTSAIVNELVYCGTKSRLGMCNRQGTSTETSCRGLWVKHILPDEQSAFVTNLRTLPSDDFEAYRERFADVIKMRICAHHQLNVHENVIKDDDINDKSHIQCFPPRRKLVHLQRKDTHTDIHYKCHRRRKILKDHWSP